MTIEPIFGTGNGEVRIRSRGIGVVSHVFENLLLVLRTESRVLLAYDRSCVNVISIMKVVVVIPAVSIVCPLVAEPILANESAPSRVIHKVVTVLPKQPRLECGLNI